MSQVKGKLNIRREPGIFYRLLRAYADPAFIASYSRVRYAGLENIPEGCAVIVAPNHSNGLMDPLAAMSLGRCPSASGRPSRISPMIFAARADMFRIPVLRSLLLYLYVTPVMRVRDGFSHLGENAGIMDAVSDRLCDGVPYCIMAEGTQRDKHSLLPLLKGIFRVALQTDDKLGGRMPVVILPVGIEYGNYWRYRSSMLVNVGKPLDVSEFRRSHPELTQPELMNAMRAELTARMKSLFLCIDDDGDYGAVLELSLIASGFSGGRGTDLYDRMMADRRVVGRLYSMRDSEDASVRGAYAGLLKLGNEAAELRRGAGISASSYSGLHLPLLRRPALFRPSGNDVAECSTGAVSRAAVLALTFPYWLFSVAVTSPVLAAVELLCRVQEDRAFLVSLRYAVAAFALPVLWIVYAALLFALLPGHLWWAGLAVLLLFCPAYTFAHDWFKSARLLLSDLRFRRNVRLQEIVEEVRGRMSRETDL